MIGGDSFAVKLISSSTNLAGNILVGGVVEMFDVNLSTFLSSFLYLLKTSDCSVLWSIEPKAIDYDQQPHVLWSHDDQYAYMLGYGGSTIAEYLVVMKDPHLSRPARQGDPDTFRLAADASGVYALE